MIFFPLILLISSHKVKEISLYLSNINFSLRTQILSLAVVVDGNFKRVSGRVQVDCAC